MYIQQKTIYLQCLHLKLQRKFLLNTISVALRYIHCIRSHSKTYNTSLCKHIDDTFVQNNTQTVEFTKRVSFQKDIWQNILKGFYEYICYLYRVHYEKCYRNVIRLFLAAQCDSYRDKLIECLQRQTCLMMIRTVQLCGIKHSYKRLITIVAVVIMKVCIISATIKVIQLK